jgi:predicted adenylyl cyclase CyaB
MKNIEIKSPLLYKDVLLSKLISIDAKNIWTKEQLDVFYNITGKDSWLKLRCENNSGSSDLISYIRSSFEAGPRLSDYLIAHLEYPQDKNIAAVLKHSLGEKVTVRKLRDYWHYKNTKIHIDTVDGLGNFIELETLTIDISEEEAFVESNEVILLLGLDVEKFISVPYAELLLGKK